MTQNTFSFTLPLSNPDARRFLDLKSRVEQPEQTDWQASPQPDGVWIHGAGDVPQDMLATIQTFIRDVGAVDEVAFTFADPENQSGGAVVIIAEGWQELNMRNHLDDWRTISIEALRAAPAPEDDTHTL